MKLETYGGNHIREVLQKALAMAQAESQPVDFDFNGHTYSVWPDDTYESAKARAEQALGFAILSAEEESARDGAELDRMRRESADAIAKAGVMTEAEMRATDVPWLDTPEALSAYISSLVERPHDYGSCVYAMSMAAVAAYRYVAKRLGTTGFQAGCADLDILKRTRGIKGPFAIVNGEDMLYPQYDIRSKVDEWLKEWTPWAAEEAQKKLAEDRQFVHPDVLARWQQLAKRRSRKES